MALASGTRLGSYEVVAQIGAGGMGEVYQAHDTKLGRDVAIKVLPANFVNDPDRLLRFQREARILAALNHANIATIYGLEQSGGVHYLVMELVSGETLAERLKAGLLGIEEALKIALQIAEALEAAHEKSIIHRDLKPANVKVTPEGKVKVLDFGLAKAFAGDAANDDPSNSPTLSQAATMQGVILGTAAYMSPEQARGKACDKRTDIWAFGCVLYELVTGKQAFYGEDITEILAAVVKSEPDWSVLPATVPAKVRDLLRHCLQKDKRLRLRDAGDAQIEIQDALAAPKDSGATPSAAAPRSMLAWAVAAALGLITAASMGFALLTRPTATQKTSTRFTISLPPGQEITTYPAISRDGRTVAYVTQQGTDDAQLYLRDLNSFESRAVPGSSGARQPFFSPDGKWVAFFAQGQLQKAEVAGGSPIRMAEAPLPFGGTWKEDNTIIYVASLGSGLLRIPANGGTPESLTKPDGAAGGYAHVFPQALPGGRSVLFTTWGQTQGGAVLSMDSGRWETVLPRAAWGAAIFEAINASKGRLLVVDEAASIRAAPMDAAHPIPTSADTSVLADVYYDVESESRGWLAVSNTGTAVYAPGNPAKTSLVWVNREGKVEPLGKDQDVYREVSLSPDGTKAIVRDGLDLWIHDLRRGTRSRLTSGNTANLDPVWSPDSMRIIFASNRGGDWDIYSQPADGSRPPEVLLKRPYDQYPLSVLAGGTLLYAEIHPKTGIGLWTLSPDGKISPFRVTPFNERAGQFSPGPEAGPHWVAYTSDESGRFEIYVQSYPGGANRIIVSNGGGILPRWSRDGKELFYVTGDAVVSVAIRPDGSLGAPSKLFARSNFLFNYRYSSYSVSPDGRRFLMIQRDPGSVPRQLNVILNWSDELDRPAPKEPK
jgi:serine/threonine protein kinase/Tol biopolymer transport system component